jgi:hypothetical protein
MRTNPAVSRGWLIRHPQATKQRDVVIHFESMSRDFVWVTETRDGERISGRLLPRITDVVSGLEQQYIFFADEADKARKLIRRGRSFNLSVYLRQA